MNPRYEQWLLIGGNRHGEVVSIIKGMGFFYSYYNDSLSGYDRRSYILNDTEYIFGLGTIYSSECEELLLDAIRTGKLTPISN